ncbi:type II and III secretion system protein [Photobacterium indicum]|uniref:type II and III secretion system protein n=1 Tax=Photobacterium indicum TaxID=81447 RepID=UPI003D1086AC
MPIMLCKRKSLWVSILLTTFALSGCVSQDYTDNQQTADNVQSTIDSYRPAVSLNNVESITRPPVLTTPIVVDNSVEWANEKADVQSNGLPLSTVLSSLMNGVDAAIWFDNDVDANTPIIAHMNASRDSIFNLLASQTGYGFVVTDNRLEVRQYLTETFVINMPTGEYSGQQGSQGQSSGEGEDTTVEGQYINVAYKDQDVFTQVSDAIEIVLEDNDEDGEMVGGVKAIPALSALLVRTTPDRMSQVREVVKRYQGELTKQVLLTARVLEFRSNRGTNHGIDWNLLKDVGEGSLQFVIPGTTTTASSAGYGLAFQGTGKWDGSTAFIKALEQQGTVSTETPISFLALSSQPARISQDLVTPYLSEVSTEVTDTTTSTSVTRDEEHEGVDMMITPNVQKGYVWLRTAGKLSKIVGQEDKAVGDTELRFFKTREANINFTNKLRYGQTVVIASIKQQTTGADKSSSYGIDGAGSQTTNTETVETLVLLTPRRVQ